MADLEGPPPDDTASTGQDSAPDSTASTTPVGTRPPVTWTNEAQAAWNSLPEQVRLEVARRESEIQAKLTETDQARKLADGLTHYTQAIAQAGYEPAAYINNVLGWADALRGQPGQALMALSQQYVQDAATAKQLVEALSQRFNLDGFGDWSEPRQQQDNSALLSLEQRLRSQEVAAARREWQDFTASHPDAVGLQEKIAAEIAANPALSFAAAYERARWLDPQAREKLLAEQATAKAKEARAKSAQAAGRVLPRGRSADSVAPVGSVRETIDAVWAKAGMRE
jgi:hypothetical protein